MRARRWTVALAAATTLAVVGSMLMLPAAMAAPGSGPRTAAATASNSLPSSTCDEAGGTRTCHLWADEGTLGLPGLGAPIDIWGFALGTDTAADGPVSLPGPTIVANVGETVEIVLHNELAANLSLAVPGFASFAQDTTGIGPDDATTYAFSASGPGTFLYEAGLTANGDRQVAMGLYGALVVRPALATSAYGTLDTAFDQEELLVFSEIDPALHSNPSSYDMRDYHPTYWLLNGKAYPETSGIATPGGTAVLFRWVNAGLENQSVGSFRLYERIVGAGGRAFEHPYSVLAETIPAGATLDAIAAVPNGPEGSQIAIGSAALHLDNAGVGVAGGPVPFGGMLTFLTITAAGPDTVGPSTTLNLSATLTTDSTTVTLSGTGNDTLTGGANVDAAEFFVDAPCVDGGGTAMSLVGAPAPIVNLSATLGALVEGDHAITAHSHDTVGNWGACTAPKILRVDTTDPLTSDVSAAPNPSNGSGSVTLTASANDPVSSLVNSNIVAAEWFENPATAEGAGTAMSAADSFDTPTEGLTASINLNGWSLGSHTLYVRAKDAAGNWGAPSSTSLEINDILFMDGFESGTLSAWNGGATGAPTVTAAAAMAGTVWGMNATLISGAAAYVTDTTPASETSYHARFYYNPHGWLPNGAPGNGQHLILAGRTTTNQPVFQIQSRKTGGGNGQYQVRLQVARQGGTTSTTWFSISNPGPHSIEIAWQSASSATVSFYIDGALRQTLTALNTSARTLDRIHLGVQSLPAAATGSVYFDEFKSTRFAYIGP